MYDYTPTTTDLFEISLYTRYLHILTLIRYHSLCARLAHADGRLTAEQYHLAGVERWSDMADLCEIQMTARCIRELTQMVYDEFTCVDQVNVMLDVATSALKLSNSQFAMRPI